MSRKFLGILATGALVAFSGVPARATIAISSQFNVGVYAAADSTDPSTFQHAAFSDSQFGTLNPYSQSLSVTSTAVTGTLTTTSAATATWASADAGEVTMTGMGWTVATGVPCAASINGAIPGGLGPIWTYTFTATADGSFDMSYDVSATGYIFGLQGMYIGWSGPGGDLDLTNSYDPTASGLFSRSLTNGQTYQIEISNWGNISSDGGFTDAGSMDGDFKWQISAAVPEPATMLTLAIGGLSLLARRRKTKHL